MTVDGESSRSGPGVRYASVDEFRPLVEAAFEQARNSGKPDWEMMTSAVLKNRLLSLTDRKFSESRYGSPSFIHLVRQVPDLLTVVDENPPFRLRINSRVSRESISGLTSAASGERAIGASREPFRETDWRRYRIRDDIWRAVIDYGSGFVYVLDPETNIARPQSVDDVGLPALPTITPAEMIAWREEFVNSLPEDLKQEREQELQEWIRGPGRQAELPRPIRGRWAELVKRNVVQRVHAWFQERGAEPPDDLLLLSETRGMPPRTEEIDEVVRTRQLRDLLIRAVQVMDYDEMVKVSLPASVILKTIESRPRQDG